MEDTQERAIYLLNQALQGSEEHMNSILFTSIQGGRDLESTSQGK